jgi:hypothetical protein
VLPPRDAAPTAPREASAEPGVAGLAAYIVTCHERRPALEATLARFRRTDWGRDPKLITDDGTGPDRRARVHATWQKALERVARGTADLALIMEDDLDFNRHLRHNLTAWVPLRGRDGAAPFFASIYDVGAGGAPGAPQASGDHYRIASPTLAWGGHAIIVSRFMAGHFVRYWGEEDGTADIRMPRLAARLTVILLHTPSLVQHIGDDSAWSGLHHRTADFDRDWRAAPALASSLPARAGAGAGRD